MSKCQHSNRGYVCNEFGYLRDVAALEAELESCRVQHAAQYKRAEALEARCRELEGDFRQALAVISDYYWAQSRKAGQKVDERARGFLAEMNAKHAGRS